MAEEYNVSYIKQIANESVRLARGDLGNDATVSEIEYLALEYMNVILNSIPVGTALEDWFPYDGCVVIEDES